MSVEALPHGTRYRLRAPIGAARPALELGRNLGRMLADHPQLLRAEPGDVQMDVVVMPGAAYDRLSDLLTLVARGSRLSPEERRELSRYGRAP